MGPARHSVGGPGHTRWGGGQPFRAKPSEQGLYHTAQASSTFITKPAHAPVPRPHGEEPEAGLGRALGEPPSPGQLILEPDIKPSKVSRQYLEQTEGNVPF